MFSKNATILLIISYFYDHIYLPTPIFRKCMHQSSLINHIKIFSKEDIKQFDNFLKSPYHNTNKKAISLFEIIKKHYPDYEHPELQKEVIFAKLFPDKAPKGTNLAQLSVELIKLIKQYLAHEFFGKSYAEKQLALISELANRNYMNGLKDEIENGKKYIDLANTQWDVNYFYLNYKISDAEFAYHIRIHNHNANIDPNNWLDSIDSFTILLKLRTIASIISRSNVLLQSYNLRLQQNIIDCATESPFSEMPLIQIY